MDGRRREEKGGGRLSNKMGGIFARLNECINDVTVNFTSLTFKKDLYLGILMLVFFFFAYRGRNHQPISNGVRLDASF